ncbi:hypothetical protein D3C81_504560 [compost metagenome]
MKPEQKIGQLQNKITIAKKKQQLWRDIGIASDARLHSSLLGNSPSNKPELFKTIMLRKVYSESGEFTYANLKSISKHKPDSSYISEFTDYFNKIAGENSIPSIEANEVVTRINKYYLAAKNIREPTLKSYKEELKFLDESEGDSRTPYKS